MKKDNADKALALLQKAIERKNDIRIGYLDAGTILARQKRYPEAATALQKALALDPTNRRTLSTWGMYTRRWAGLQTRREIRQSSGTAQKVRR